MPFPCLPVATRWLAILFLAVQSTSAQSAIIISVINVSPTQAILRYDAPDEKPCRVVASEQESFSPSVFDTDATQFKGANQDNRPGSIVNGQMRVFVLGRRTSERGADGAMHSRALAAETTYYVQVDCGSATGTTTLTTTVPDGSVPESYPLNKSGWGNMAFPEFDWNDLTKPVIDPQTGVKIYAADPATWSTNAPFNFGNGWYTGGNGWKNPENANAYGNQTATTSGTDPIALIVDRNAAYTNDWFDGGASPYRPVVDMAVDIFGSATGGNDDDRSIEVALSNDSGQTPITNWITIVLPKGSAKEVGTTPSNFPSTFFQGWGKRVPRTVWPRYGKVDVTDHTVVETQFAQHGQFFDQDWPAGTKIFIAGSAPACANNLCTITSVENGLKLNIAESLTLKGVDYRAASFAYMIRKKTTSGSVSVSARARVAEAFTQNVWSGDCSKTPVTTNVDAQGQPLGRTITGFACIFPTIVNDPGALYFIGTSEPTVRMISNFRNPLRIPDVADADQIISPAVLVGPQVPAFDPDDPSIIYLTAATNGGSVALFKVKYNGDWRVNNELRGTAPTISPPITHELTWTNVTPSAQKRDLRTQILAKTGYNEAEFGGLTGVNVSGFSGKYLILQKLMNGQESAGWIFAFNMQTGDFYKAWRTDNGSSHPLLKYAGIHNIEPIEGNPAFLLTSRGLTLYDGNRTYGGPFTTKVLAVKRGNNFDYQNTALPWPPDGSYDTTCPSDINGSFVSYFGVNGNQCATIRMKALCSTYATKYELEHHPCPWDAKQSSIADFQQVDWLRDFGAPYGPDSEGFMIARKKDLGNGEFELVLLRNANYVYCAIGKEGVDSDIQFRHKNGWSLTAVPYDSCSSVVLLVGIEDDKVYQVNYSLSAGHTAVSNVEPDRDTWVGSNALVMYRRPRSQVRSGIDFVYAQDPPFAGFRSARYDLQSYPWIMPATAPPDFDGYGLNFRHFNGGTGASLEVPNQAINDDINPRLQDGTTSVYKINYTGTANIKRVPFSVWAGEKVLHDKSGPKSLITDDDAFQYCYALKAGECRADSAANDFYVNIPHADLMQKCWASQVALRVPCAVVAPGVGSHIVQFKFTTKDQTGQFTRKLSRGLMGPGNQYVYSSVHSTPDGKYIYFGGFLIGGYYNGLMMLKNPSLPSDGVDRTSFTRTQLTLQPPSDMHITSADVRFGYAENGRPRDFFCTTRREACYATPASEDSTFNFASDSHPSIPCETGCTVTIATLPQHVAYYQVDYRDDSGAVVSSDRGVAIEAQSVSIKAPQASQANQANE